MIHIRHGDSEGVAEKGVVRLYFHSLVYRARYSLRPDKCQEKKGQGWRNQQHKECLGRCFWSRVRIEILIHVKKRREQNEKKEATRKAKARSRVKKEKRADGLRTRVFGTRLNARREREKRESPSGSKKTTVYFAASFVYKRRQVSSTFTLDSRLQIRFLFFFLCPRQQEEKEEKGDKSIWFTKYSCQSLDSRFNPFYLLFLADCIRCFFISFSVTSEQMPLLKFWPSASGCCAWLL